MNEGISLGQKRRIKGATQINYLVEEQLNREKEESNGVKM